MREGTGVSFGAIGFGAVTGALIGSGMNALVEGMREQRQAREEAAYSAALRMPWMMPSGSVISPCGWYPSLPPHELRMLS